MQELGAVRNFFTYGEKTFPGTPGLKDIFDRYDTISRISSGIVFLRDDLKRNGEYRIGNLSGFLRQDLVAKAFEEAENAESYPENVLPRRGYTCYVYGDKSFSGGPILDRIFVKREFSFGEDDVNNFKRKHDNPEDPERPARKLRRSERIKNRRK